MVSSSRWTLAATLLKAAESIDDLPRSDLQVLLRRAALRLRNEYHDAGVVMLDGELVELFDALAASADPPVSRNEMVSAALTDWAIRQGYVADEDGGPKEND